MIRKRLAADGLSLVLLSAFAIASLTGSFSQANAQGEHGGHSQNGDVDFIANTEFIRGHLAQALANKQAGNTELAVAHASHPVEEVYSLIEGELAEKTRNLTRNLRESCRILPTR